jgi:hypothetical protein
MEKLGSDLDGCLSKLDSRDILVTKLQYDLQRSNRSLQQQIVESLETSVLLAVLPVDVTCIMV